MVAGHRNRHDAMKEYVKCIEDKCDLLPRCSRIHTLVFHYHRGRQYGIMGTARVVYVGQKGASKFAGFEKGINIFCQCTRSTLSTYGYNDFRQSSDNGAFDNSSHNNV